MSRRSSWRRPCPTRFSKSSGSRRSQDGASLPRTTGPARRGSRFWATDSFSAGSRAIRGVVGRDVLLDGMSATIVGIAPPHFSYPAPSTELYVPLRLPRDRPDQGGSPYRSFRILNVVARLQDETSLAQATVRIAALSARLAREYPDSNLAYELEVEDMREVERGPLRAPLFLLGGSLFLLLLLICANVSGLWIARLVGRERELAVRAAVGASRARLFRELLAEALVVSILGFVAGGIVGAWIAAGSRAAAPPGLPIPAAIEPGGPYPALFLALLLPMFLGFASAPALLGRRRNLATTLRPGGRVEGGSAVARKALVVFEMALASTLLVSAVLLLKSFRALDRVETRVPSGERVLHERRASFHALSRGPSSSAVLRGDSISDSRDARSRECEHLYRTSLRSPSRVLRDPKSVYGRGPA